MLRKGVLLLTSSIVLQTNNSYFVKHSLVEKTKLYLIFVTLMFQLKTNQRQFNAGKIFIVEILICKSFVIKQISSSQITILVNNEILLLITTTNGITTSVSLFLANRLNGTEHMRTHQNRIHLFIPSDLFSTF